MRPRLICVMAFVLGAGTANAQVSVPYEDSAAVAQGKEIYAAQCAVCHGKKLEGEVDWQIAKENGMRPAPPHDDTGHTWHHADEVLFNLTKFGLKEMMSRRGMDYESDMIGFGDVLSNEEILATLAYIKSTWPTRVVDTHNDINAAQ